MASGQQAAEQNLAAFIAWVESKTDDDFREYVHRGKLKRSEIAAECSFGKSALVQNPAIKAALDNLEDNLRKRNILPALNNSKSAEPPMRDKEAGQRRKDIQRLNALEQENASLRVQLHEAKAKLEKYKVIENFLKETNRMPR